MQENNSVFQGNKEEKYIKKLFKKVLTKQMKKVIIIIDIEIRT